jgi:hypothetical protein
VRVRRQIVQFRRKLMILVVRSIVISGGHGYRLSICPDLLWASLASL